MSERMLPGLGMDRLVHSYASFLAQDGHDVRLHTPEASLDLVPSGLTHTPLPPIRSRRAPIQDWEVWGALPALPTSKERHWVLATPPYTSLSGFLGDTTILHGGTSPPTGLGWKGTATYLWRELSSSLVHLPLATRIVTLSKFLAKGLPASVHGATAIIPPGWDHYPLKTREESALMRERLLGGRQHLLLVMGRLNAKYQPYKGLLDILRIVRSLPHVRLAASGWGDDRDGCALQHAGVAVLPQHPSEDMGNLIGAADLVVMASRWEGYGLPAAEAQFQGVPVIALNRGALSEVVHQGVSGMLVDDVQGLADGIRNLLDEPQRRKEMGLAGQERAQSRTWAHAAATFSSFLFS